MYIFSCADARLFRRKHDQNGCAARITYHGIGIRGNKNEDDKNTIQQHIERVLTDASFKLKMDTIMNIESGAGQIFNFF